MSSLGFLILAREHGSHEPWQSVEGCFASYVEAEAYADAEVGADYIIVEIVTLPTHGATGEKL